MPSPFPAPYSEDAAVVFSDPARAVWDLHLLGAPTSHIAQDLRLPLRRVRALLASPPPAPLDADPRLLTGLRPLWLGQQGTRLLESSPGVSCPFLLAFFPLRFPQTLFRRAMVAIARDARARHGLVLSVGRLNEPLPFRLALRLATHARIPCWCVAADGALSYGPPSVPATGA